MEILMKKQRGVSLLELMIVVVIIAIIASVAYPSYQQTINKTRRADCAGALVGLSNAMERYFTVNGTYLGAAKNGNNTGQPAIYPTVCPISGDTPTYSLRIQNATASTYRVRATPINAQSGDKCGRLFLTNTGKKTIGAAHSGVGWKDCW